MPHPPDRPSVASPADPTRPTETLREFAQSFAYGTRTDLLFKFIKRLPEDAAAEFLRGLLELLGRTVDDGRVDRLLAYVYEWNVRGYADEAAEARAWVYEDGPFTPLTRPLAQARIGLLTTTGHFVAGRDPRPFGVPDMTQAEAIMRIQEFLQAAPQLSTIPIDTPPVQLRVRHPGYDIRAVAEDRNAAFPVDRLCEAAAEGVIRDVAPEAHSFVGVTAQVPLIREGAPRWAQQMRAQAVDAVLLVPV